MKTNKYFQACLPLIAALTLLACQLSSAVQSATPTHALDPFFLQTGTWPAATSNDQYLVGVLPQIPTGAIDWNGQEVFVVAMAFKPKDPSLPTIPSLLENQAYIPFIQLTNGNPYKPSQAIEIDCWPSHADPEQLWLRVTVSTPCDNPVAGVKGLMVNDPTLKCGGL
jgi:hypothetical protein